MADGSTGIFRVTRTFLRFCARAPITRIAQRAGKDRRNMKVMLLLVLVVHKLQLFSCIFIRGSDTAKVDLWANEKLMNTFDTL